MICGRFPFLTDEYTSLTRLTSLVYDLFTWLRRQYYSLSVRVCFDSPKGYSLPTTQTEFSLNDL
jgi:hypothetical protein